MTTRLGIVLSGTGRTLTNLLECIARDELDAAVACVVSDREDVKGLQLGRDAGVPTYGGQSSDGVWSLMLEHRVDLVCLCGYLKLLPIREGFERRVLNIHPALLPKHGGKGFYGHHVHEAVLAAGDAESGCTVHYCDGEYDQGQVLVQRRVPVRDEDDADALAARVFEAECAAYPEAIRVWQRDQSRS